MHWKFWVFRSTVSAADGQLVQAVEDFIFGLFHWTESEDINQSFFINIYGLQFIFDNSDLLSI